MTDTTYNGWSNYATWRVNLEMCQDILNSMEDLPETLSSETARADIADMLKEQCEEIVCDYGDATTLAHNMALAFLGQVNWWEIADNYMADYE